MTVKSGFWHLLVFLLGSALALQAPATHLKEHSVEQQVVRAKHAVLGNQHVFAFELCEDRRCEAISDLKITTQELSILRLHFEKLNSQIARETEIAGKAFQLFDFTFLLAGLLLMLSSLGFPDSSI
ncbi:MAG: hypothetical protein AAF202_04160, partial [Pseudomonadota bacterium]